MEDNEHRREIGQQDDPPPKFADVAEEAAYVAGVLADLEQLVHKLVESNHILDLRATRPAQVGALLTRLLQNRGRCSGPIEEGLALYAGLLAEILVLWRLVDKTDRPTSAMSRGRLRVPRRP